MSHFDATGESSVFMRIIPYQGWLVDQMALSNVLRRKIYGIVNTFAGGSVATPCVRFLLLTKEVNLERYEC